MSVTVNAASIGQFGRYIPVLLWLHRHATLVEPLIADLRAVRESLTLREKWEAVKHSGDLLMDAADDFPTLLGAAEEGAEYSHLDADIAEAHATFATMGVDWATLVALLPQLFPLLLQIIQLIKGV